MAIEKGYKQTEIGVIPDCWEVKKFGDTLSVKYGKSQAEIIDDSGNFPILGTGGIVGFTNHFLYGKPSIIIGRKGSIDKPQYIDKPFWTIDTAFYTKVKNEYDVKFLYYKFCCIDWYSYNEASGVPSLNAPTLEKIPFAIPQNKAEQTAIATVLSDMDEYISSLERLIAKKKAIKQGTMQNLLTGKIRLKGFKGEWKEKKLEEMADVIGGGTPSTLNLLFWNGSINWFTPTEIGKSKFISESERKITNEGLQGSSAKMLPAGTILLTSRATIGDVSILKNTGCTNQGFQSLIVKKDVSNEYLYYKLLTIKNIIMSLASGSTFLEITPNKLRQIKIFIPTLTEQTAIATILSDMDTEIETLQSKLNKAKLVKQGAMQGLLTGKIRLIGNNSTAITIELKPKKTGHNDQINEAVVISFLVYKFGTTQYPLARFRYTKYAYLLHRQAEHEAKGFLKHAGGPYKPENRYKGGESIAIKNKYISKVKNPKSGKDAFIVSENIEKALSYFCEWYGTNIQEWIEQFRYYKNEYLEVLTTVDESICDLQGQNKTITVGSIKEYIGSIPQWKEKLSKPYFNDLNIQKAIYESYKLFEGK